MPRPSSQENPSPRPSEVGAPPQNTTPSSEDNDLRESQEKIGQTLRERGDSISQTSRDLINVNDDPLIPSVPSEENSEPQPIGPKVPLEEGIRETQHALERAAVTLQTAGRLVETARSQEAATEAEAELTNARVAIIVAEQNLVELKELLQDTAQLNDDIVAVVSASEVALQEANVAVVLASEILGVGHVSTSRTEGNKGELKTNEGLSQLDKELQESLDIFDDTLVERKRILSDSTPAPVQARKDPSSGIATDVSEESEVTVASNDLGVERGEKGGLTLEQGDYKEIVNSSEESVPEDIPEAQGDDIVAKQLREAALAESDPVVKKKLWEEYRRYRTSI